MVPPPFEFRLKTKDLLNIFSNSLAITLSSILNFFGVRVIFGVSFTFLRELILQFDAQKNLVQLLKHKLLVVGLHYQY